MVPRVARPRVIVRVTCVLGITVLAISASIVPVAAEGVRLAASGVKAPVVSAGWVDTPAPMRGARVVSIPVTLNEPAPSRVTVRYSLIQGTAVLGRDLEASSGQLTFQANTSEAFIKATILSDRKAPTTPCWVDVGLNCRTFSASLSPVGGDVVVSAAQSTDAILWMGHATSGVAVGDAVLSGHDQTRTTTIDVPLTLAAPAIHAVTVTYRLESGSATIGADFRSAEGTIRFGAHQDATMIPVSVLRGPGSQPAESLVVDLTHVTGATFLRRAGIAMIATSAPGVADPLSSTYGAASLTEISSTSGIADHYHVAATTGGTNISAPGAITAPNDRVAFWPKAEASASDEEACATWSSQTPAQANRVVVQQGLVLRASTINGVTRAITVTKNIWRGAFDDLNIHLWNTSLAIPFRYFNQVDLEGYFGASHEIALPYDVCARVVGMSLQVEFWFPNRAPPAWGNTLQGGTFTLPSAWDYPGKAGWYVGHLPTGGDTVYANEYAGAPQAAPAP